jgi:RNA polymerase sigma-70 factor (ECF subfamily)
MALRQDEAYGEVVGSTAALERWALPERDGAVDVERDRTLVERCQAGDRSAFDELYHHYHRRLQRFCLQRLGEPHDAEDVMQETFTRAWKALPNFAGERRFYPWLTVIAGNLCVDTLHRRSRLTPVEESRLQAADIGTYDTEDALLQEVDSKLVAAAFGHLSERHQRVLRLREGSDWTYRQIAEHEGVGVTAIETLLWRARQALKREFMMLDDQRGKVGSLIGFAMLLPVRLVLGVAKATRHALGVATHLARSAGSGAFGSRGVFGVFGPSAAVATGAVALSMGTVLMLPVTTPLVSNVPARSAVTSSGRTSSVPDSVGSGVGLPDASGSAGPSPTAIEPIPQPVTATTGSSPVGTGPSNLPTSVTTASGSIPSSTSVPVPVSLPVPVIGANPLGGMVGPVTSSVAAATAGAGTVVGSTVTGVGNTVTGLGSTAGSLLTGAGSTVQGASTTLSSTAGGLTGSLGTTAPSATSSSGSGVGSTLPLGLGG